ncbi:MAG: glycosyltransferase family 4 protein [Gammaproteobacteria bacterium]|nr:glycosyltransferase family 4 protein [Gammaproteobacteria bacterium]
MAAVALRESPGAVSRLKIALLGYRSNPYSGGQGVYLNYLSRALADAGHAVDVISGPPYPELDPRVSLIKLPSLDLFAADNPVTALRAKHLTSATDLFEWFSMVTGGFSEPYTFGRRVLKYLKPRLSRYDIVHDNQSLSYGILRLQDLGAALTATIHHPITWDRDIALDHATDWGERLLIRRWHNFLRMQTKVANRLRHIVTVSERAKQDICKAFGIEADRITVIYNGIDTQTFKPDPQVDRHAHRLITTASADQPLKGTQHLIPAFAMLRARFPDLRLTFIGKPKPGGRTERLMEKHGVAEHIDFVHGIGTQAIRRLYARSTVAVVPSEYEGFGLPAGEAMACAVPVVSTDGGALPEVVGDAGVIVPARDPLALANAVGDLLEQPRRRDELARRGRERIETHFGWANAAAQLVDHYQHTRARRTSRNTRT